MKKSVGVALAAAVLALVALPAVAATKEPVGGRINVLVGTPTTYPAGEAFHIRHGWSLCAPQLDTFANGELGFTLEVDGVQREEDFAQVRFVSLEPGGGGCDGIINRRWVFNFPEEMTGTHSFTGHWVGPCQALVEDGQYPGPCSNPAEVVEAITRTLTVTFTS